jgi:hypothetical protein
MNRVRVELVPAIAQGIVGLGVSLLMGGAHGVRRLAEGMIWADHRSGHCHACGEVHHHYRYHCTPRCYDCRR